MLEKIYLNYSRHHLECIRKIDDIYKNVFFSLNNFVFYFYFHHLSTIFQSGLFNVGKMWDSSIWMYCELGPGAPSVCVTAAQRSRGSRSTQVLWKTGFLSERGRSWDLERSEKRIRAPVCTTNTFSTFCGPWLNTATKAYFVQLCWKNFFFSFLKMTSWRQKSINWSYNHT